MYNAYIKVCSKVLLTKGTRKSLFVVNQSNGLGEEGVVCVNIAHVAAFLAARESAAKSNNTPMVSLCVVCQDKLSAFILLPCSHFGVCACCAGHIKKLPALSQKDQNQTRDFCVINDRASLCQL